MKNRMSVKNFLILVLGCLLAFDQPLLAGAGQQEMTLKKRVFLVTGAAVVVGVAVCGCAYAQYKRITRLEDALAGEIATRTRLEQEVENVKKTNGATAQRGAMHDNDIASLRASSRRIDESVQQLLNAVYGEETNSEKKDERLRALSFALKRVQDYMHDEGEKKEKQTLEGPLQEECMGTSGDNNCVLM